MNSVSAAPGRLAQTPVLATASSKPNMMLVLDDSGSMGRGSHSRMEQAKRAAKSLVDQLSNINIGVGSFHGRGAGIDHEIVDVDKNRASLKRAIDRLRAGGGTPLIATMEQMGAYFMGKRGTQNPGNSPLASCTKNGRYNGNLSTYPDNPALKKNYSSSQVFPHCSGGGRQCLESPICHYCQKNFVVLLTDGQGWGRASAPLTNYRRHGGCSGQQLCGVAAALYDMDLRPDIDTFEGTPVKNNVITYTIGFHISQALLGNTAREGGGLYIEASDQAALTKAFARISADIKAHARGSASTASFNTRSLSTATHVYLTRYDTQDWSGDLMATSLTKDGRVSTSQWSAAKTLDTQTNYNTRVVLTYDNNVGFTKPSGCKAAPATGSAVKLVVASGSGSSGSGGSGSGGSGSSGGSAGSSSSGSSSVTGTSGNPRGVGFRYANLSPAQKADLETVPKTTATNKSSYTYDSYKGAYLAREGGIAIDQQTGDLYWADYRSHRVRKYDKTGKFIRNIGRRGSGSGQMFYPRGVAIDSNSNLWVADSYNHRLQKYNSAGVLQKTIGVGAGRIGRGNGQFYYPWDIAIDGDDNVYVADRHNRRVQVFDEDGNYLNQFGRYGRSLSLIHI